MSAITSANLLLIVLFIVPGFVLYIVWSLRYPTHNIELEKRLILFIAGSVFCLLPWFSVLRDLMLTPIQQWDSVSVILIGFTVLFLTPVAWAYFWSWMMPRLHRWFGFEHPTKRGWDYFLCQHREPVFILFHLKTGKMMGGYFGSKSFASTYPEEPEVYVECMYHVNEHGEFEAEVNGSVGGVVRGSEWERIEFLAVPNSSVNQEGVSDEGPAEGDTGKADRSADQRGGAGDAPAGAGGSSGEPKPETNAVAEGRVEHGPATEQEEVTSYERNSHV